MQAQFASAPGLNQIKRVSDVIVNRSLYPERPNLLAHRSQQLMELEEVIFTAVHDLLLSIEPVKLSNYYYRAVLDSRDLFPVLPLLRREERIMLAKDLMQYAENKEISPDFSCTYLQGMLHFFKADEKVELLKDILEKPLSLAKQTYLEEILYSAKDLKNLRYLISASQISEKSNVRRRNLKECIATAFMGTLLRGIKPPERPRPNSTRSSTVEKIKEIKAYLEGALEKLEAFKADERYKQLRNCDTYKEYRNGIKSILYQQKTFFNPSARQPKKPVATSELRDLANELLEMADVLFSYNIALSIENPKVIKTKDLRFYRLKEIQEIRKAIELLGAGRVLTTPLLNEIIRISDYEYIARRTESGPIIISDSALEDSEFEKVYPNQPLFRATALHEMFHSLQFGRTPATALSWDRNTMHVNGPCDIRSGYEEHCMLSDWQVLNKKSYTLDREKHFIKIRNNLYKLEVPQTVDGEERVYLYSETDGHVLSYMSDARFGFHRHVDCSPEEDYVEHGTDYFFLKEKAILYAPDKFLFSERRFRRYDNNNAIQRKLTESLRNLMGQVVTIQDLIENPDIIEPGLSRAEIPVGVPELGIFPSEKLPPAPDYMI